MKRRLGQLPREFDIPRRYISLPLMNAVDLAKGSRAGVDRRSASLRPVRHLGANQQKTIGIIRTMRVIWIQIDPLPLARARKEALRNSCRPGHPVGHEPYASNRCLAKPLRLIARRMALTPSLKTRARPTQPKALPELGDQTPRSQRWEGQGCHHEMA